MPRPMVNERFGSVVLSAFIGALVILLVVYSLKSGTSVERDVVQLSDCVQRAPDNCQVPTIETSHQRGFVGYYYCACITRDGRAVGYIAANSRVYRESKQPSRSREILGNDNPAVTFPVGVPHR